MDKHNNIGFLRAGVFGDTIVALHGIYATKILYPNSKLIVYTNKYGLSIYSGFSFIDKIIDISNLTNEQLIENINLYNFDIFILTNPNRKYCNPLAKTNCKKIFSFLSVGNIFKMKFKTIYYPRRFSYETHYKRILNLVRKTSPKKYDNCKFDFSKITIKPQHKQKEFINNFLTKNNIPINTNNLILINPFAHSTAYNLTLNGWENLTKKLANKYKNLIFIVITYSANPEFNINANLNNVFIFYNNDDLLNLAALLNKSRLILSPSTGTSHLANNLNIPIIWFCNYNDSFRWIGNNMNKDFFIILQKRLIEMNQKDEEYIISKAISLFEKFLKGN